MFLRPGFLSCLLPSLLLAAPHAAQGQAPTETISFRTSEGPTLAFDLSPDGQTIVFDLLGQLWLVPAAGGTARAITNAVRDVAEDLDPSFSPDGRQVVFRGERNGRTGMWLLRLDTGGPRQLTQLAEPVGIEGAAAWSPDGRTIAFARSRPDPVAFRWRSDIVLFDVTSGMTRELAIGNIPNAAVRDPVWVEGGNQIAFVARNLRLEQGGRVWMVPAGGGQATAITGDSARALAPVFTADGRHMAYFAPDSTGRVQVWVQQVEQWKATGSPIQVTNHADVARTRIRWTRGDRVMYSADGRLWNVAASGGQPSEIVFTAELAITRPRRELPQARFPEPGAVQPARGFMGMALSPDARRIAVLALGKLWVIPVGGPAQAVSDIPLNAGSLAWSSDGAEIAWSAGAEEQEDLFATTLATGATRRITALPGREAFPAYSPDGHYLAFLHEQDKGRLRLVETAAGDVSDTTGTRNLGEINTDGTSPPVWSPASDGLLVAGGIEPSRLGHATFVPLTGEHQDIKRFPEAPIFLQWPMPGTIHFVRHDRVWQAAYDATGMIGNPVPLSSNPALYASASRDGTLLFVSDSGLRLRSPDGRERNLGWPISFTPPPLQPTLIRNVRIVDGAGAPITTPRDILIEGGRIARIAAAGSISAGNVPVVDAEGRVAIPGLMDLHAHTYRPDLLPGFAYFGVTTVRDQGSSMAPLVGYADAIAAGVIPGPRVSYGGFQYYSDWSFDEDQGRGVEPEADPEHVARSVALAEAFGAQHIKTRTFRRWDINGRMVTDAHRRGMRATGHCVHQLPLIAAGIDAKEHIGFCAQRADGYLYDDLIQLYRAAGIGVVPTVVYLDFAAQLSGRPSLLDGDSTLAPFVPPRDNFQWMLNLRGAAREEWVRDAQRAREVTAKLWRSGITIGTGTDIWQIPVGAHMELEQLVAAGIPPLNAIQAATGGAAWILGAERDLGTIEEGKRADIVILDADPLVDIRNTRRIWQVIQDGRIVDRPAIRDRAAQVPSNR
jgi:Tol biopolymer transport system component